MYLSSIAESSTDCVMTGHCLINYQVLREWIVSRPLESLQDMEVSLGSFPGQFFARHQDKYRWKVAHKNLDEELINHVRNPRTRMHVVLGISDTYIYWEDGEHVGWAVDTGYPSLQAIMLNWVENKDKKGRVVVGSHTSFLRLLLLR